MALSLADYKGLIRQLLPRGIAWNGENIGALVGAFGVECHRADQQIEQVFLESLPDTTDQCLPDWERVAGLPDVAFPAGSTADQRRASLVAKLTATGGQSRAYYIAIAARLGYTITIEDCYQPFCAGRSHAGDLLYSTEWAFAFTVNASASLVAGDRTRLEAAINALKPAHTAALFVYS